MAKKKQKTLLELLDQDKIWIDKDGNTHKITDMSMEYLANLIRFLTHRAEVIKFRYDMYMVKITSGPFGPRGEAATDAVDHELDVLFQTPADEWLDDTKLVRALRNQLSPPVNYMKVTRSDGSVWYREFAEIAVRTSDKESWRVVATARRRPQGG